MGFNYLSMKEYGVKENQVRGIIYLFKNDKMIREKTFYRKYRRKEFLNEFMEIIKQGNGESFYITIKLDI